MTKIRKVEQRSTPSMLDGSMITRSMVGEVFLPREIVAEILSRSPVKSLLVLKCVCKLWYSIIEDRHFVRMHSRQTKYKYVASEDEDNKDSELQCVCDGLLVEKHQTTNKYSIRNPATRTKVDLPDPHDKPAVTEIMHLPTSDVYKVINVFGKEGNRFGGCEVLTVGIDLAWRKLEVPILHHLNGEQMCRSLSTRIGYVAHIMWFSDEGCTTIARHIVCIEVETEGVETLAVPNALFASWDDIWPIKWGKHFSLYKMVGLELHVWVLEDYKCRKWADREIIISLSFLSKHTSISHEFIPLVLVDGWLLFITEQAFRIEYHVESGRVYHHDDKLFVFTKSSLVNPCRNLKIPPLLNT